MFPTVYPHGICTSSTTYPPTVYDVIYCGGRYRGTYTVGHVPWDIYCGRHPYIPWGIYCGAYTVGHILWVTCIYTVGDILWGIYCG